VPPTNAEGKKQISEKTRNEKIATKNKYWGFRVLRSGAHWGKLRGASGGAAINCHKSLHKITNCISGLAGQPRISTRFPPPRKIFDFSRCCCTTVWPPTQTKTEKEHPTRFSSVEFYGSQIKFALQFASFFGSVFWPFLVFLVFMGPKWKWKLMSCVSQSPVDKDGDKDVPFPGHTSVYYAHMCTYRYIWYPPGAAYRTNCTGSPAKTRELLSLPLSLSHIAGFSWAETRLMSHVAPLSFLCA